MWHGAMHNVKVQEYSARDCEGADLEGV
jgi:hypothetical protein